jgi:hypothetical protein
MRPSRIKAEAFASPSQVSKDLADVCQISLKRLVAKVRLPADRWRPAVVHHNGLDLLERASRDGIPSLRQVARNGGRIDVYPIHLIVSHRSTSPRQPDA